MDFEGKEELFRIEGEGLTEPLLPPSETPLDRLLDRVRPNSGSPENPQSTPEDPICEPNVEPPENGICLPPQKPPQFFGS